MISHVYFPINHIPLNAITSHSCNLSSPIFSRQGGTVGTTTPLPNGLIEEIIDDEMAKMNWEPGMKETLMLGAWSTSFWRLQIIHFKRYIYA